jgi:hypothetical protein
MGFAALLGGFRLLTVQLIYTFALHRLDQQFAERPDQGINAVRRIPRGGPIDIRGSRSIRIHRNARCEPRRCAAASCVSVSCRATSPGEQDPAQKKLTNE